MRMRINVVLATGLILVASMIPAHASNKKPLAGNASSGATQCDLDSAVSLLKFGSTAKERRPQSFVRDDGSEVSPGTCSAGNKPKPRVHLTVSHASSSSTGTFKLHTNQHDAPRMSAHADANIYETPSGSGILQIKPARNLLSRHLSASVFPVSTR